jgi:peptide/nickel transport system ATP-binding protein/oligopeptide transport system ATP-binding protein
MTTGEAVPIARAVGLVKTYASGRGGAGPFGKAHEIRAVDGVDLDIPAGATTALVGESGCGKSTTGRLLLALESPTEGRVEYRGVDLAGLDAVELRAFRRKAQVVFQDPFASLNPRQTVGSMLHEILQVHRLAERDGAGARVAALIDRVGLAADAAGRYPHEFSGGQRQRIGIARALSVEPEFIVLDEPVSALDVSVQAQILNLLRELQTDLGLTYLFVSHDLGVVRHIADRVVVMRAGRIVEQGEADEVLDRPREAYTRELLEAVPKLP